MEQTKERRKLALAILISLFLHLAVGYSLAAFGGVFKPTPPPEDKPSELTIVDLSRRRRRRSYQRIRLSCRRRPRRSRWRNRRSRPFESNANSIAASKSPRPAIFRCRRRTAKERPVTQSRHARFFTSDPGIATAAPNRNQLSRRNPSLRPQQHHRNQGPRKHPSPRRPPRPSLHRSLNSMRC